MKITFQKLRDRKNSGKKIVMLTSYDFPASVIEDECGIDVQLVGDSLGTNVLGYQDVSEVTMDDMLHHLKAVARGAKRSFILCDMPYGSFRSENKAVENARVLYEAGADGVKMEGEYPVLENIRRVSAFGIPVCAHIGYTPQTDGTKASVQGKDFSRAWELLKLAGDIEDAGAFMLVLELIPSELAGIITDNLSIPTIGIGAGPYCDGQVQVVHDICGFSARQFRHSRVFGDVSGPMKDAVSSYVSHVRQDTFPTLENASKLPSETKSVIEEKVRELRGKS